MKKKLSWMLGIAAVLIVVVTAYGQLPPVAERAYDKGDLELYDARSQASEFISYYHSIALSPEQEKIKHHALSAIPAPCCEDYSIATCCCPCNLAKSVWGLSHFLIAEQGYDASKVKEAAEQWISFTNKSGYAGDACYKGRCNQSFEKDGCGGMDEKRIS
jgi:hypothetical protein